MNKHTIRYANGMKRHVNNKERDLLLAARQIEETGHNEYRFIESLSLSNSFTFLVPVEGAKFLEGSFVVELKGKKRKERLEKPGAMIDRLVRSGVLSIKKERP